jgi:hypothetical protein
LLSRSLSLSLSLSLLTLGQVVASDQDVTVSVETNSRSPVAEVGGAAINERHIASPVSSGPPAALKLLARVNVMDLIADGLAIKGSLLRCAQVLSCALAL